ncbi:MAG: undecaprenyl-diphosphate phosphatase [Parcubacteria group bacterium]|nr:undecaprenyl-diphosphate phosphatase [Parcubacteria group bacterium]
MSLIHAIFLGLVEGLTEFIPVSSSAHLILARSIFSIHGNDLAIDAIFQLATILAVAVYFFGDLWHLLKAFVRLLMRKIVADEDKRMIFAIILGTIPAVVLGLLLQKDMETIFRSTHLVAWTLILGSLLMVAADRYAKQNREVTVKRGIVVGFFQSLALIPGISRSGATISGGLFMGFKREEAARFSFLLSFPVIVGAGLKSILDIYKTGQLNSVWDFNITAGFVVAFVAGLASIHFLISYLKSHKLTVFVWYRVIVALLIFIFL